MSVAQVAATQEQVLYRHRRRPPAIHFGVVGAGFLLLGAFAASNPLVQVALVLAAVAAVALGWLGRERLWVEDQLITETAAVIVHADGARYDLAFADVARVAARRDTIAFVRGDGAELRFNRNPHAKKVRLAVNAVAPTLDWVDEVDPACDT
jgi:hypothetical protein